RPATSGAITSPLAPSEIPPIAERRNLEQSAAWPAPRPVSIPIRRFHSMGARKMLRVVSRKALGRLALVITLSLFATPKAFAQARDVAGARDFPGIGRFGGSAITGYQVKDFDAARIQAAPF